MTRWRQRGGGFAGGTMTEHVIVADEKEVRAYLWVREIGNDGVYVEKHLPVLLDGDDGTGLIAAMGADELGHRPGLERRAVLPEAREVADQDAHQFALDFPEVREQFPLFFGGQEVRGENRRRPRVACVRQR